MKTLLKTIEEKIHDDENRLKTEAVELTKRNLQHAYDLSRLNDLKADYEKLKITAG